MKANSHEIPIDNFARRLTHARRPVSFLCLLRQVSSVLPQDWGSWLRPDADEARVVTWIYGSGIAWTEWREHRNIL